jgi:uncharacterized protein
MMPILLMFFPFAPTLLLVSIIHWFGNIWKITLFREGVRWRLILFFGVPGVLFTFLGARLVFSISEILLSQILGGFIITYVVFLFFNPTFTFKQSVLTATVGGALSGFFAGIFGVGGAVRSVFISAFNLPKTVYIATAGVIGLVVDSARLTTYIFGGTTLQNNLLWGMFLFIPVSFIGAHFAKRIVSRIPQKQFRLVITVFLLLAGIKLLFFP